MASTVVTGKRPREEAAVVNARTQSDGAGALAGAAFGLPGGWVDCSSGEDLFGELFVPMKTPLDARWDAAVPESGRHSIEGALRRQELLGRKVGLAIDLTKGSRYYHPEEWERHGVAYQKIRCAGHGSSPTPEEVDSFHDIVYTWRMREENQGKYIIVHCTHGHNRTGFMIIHHLMRCSMKGAERVEEHVRLFAKIRPPGIYKRGYLDDLFTAYHEHWPSALRNPPLPEWKDADGEDEGGSSPPPPNQWKSARSVGFSGPSISHEDIVGEDICPEHEQKLQVLVSSILLRRPVAPSEVNFAGSQPVSLDRSNISLINERPYRVTWKADGTRYMVLLMHDGVYLIGRDNRVRRVWVRFPYTLKQENAPPMLTRHNYTLLDGEMVVDKDKATGRLERRLLVFDIMCLCGQSFVDMPFSQRFQAIDTEVMRHRDHEKARRRPEWYDWSAETFKVRRKDFWEMSATRKVLERMIPALPHESDGLIMQCWNDPYVPRTCDEILKWKYGSMNSVDFKLKADASTGGDAMLYVMLKSQLKQLAGARIRFPGGESPMDFHGLIVECTWDEPSGCWVYMRTRSDKLNPNSMDVYTSVKKSIDDNITQEELLDCIDCALEFPAYQPVNVRREADGQQRQQHAAEAAPLPG